MFNFYCCFGFFFWGGSIFIRCGCQTFQYKMYHAITILNLQLLMNGNIVHTLLDFDEQVCCIKQIIAYACKRRAEADTKQQGTVRFVAEYGVTVAPKPSSSVCEYPILFFHCVALFYKKEIKKIFHVVGKPQL